MRLFPSKPIARSATWKRRHLRMESLEPRMVLVAGPIVINEFLASNNGVVLDSDGDASDFIELFNPTTAPVDIGGWHLTDDASDLAKWTFPSITIQPGQYLVVFASNKDRTNPAEELHTNFAISAGGEYLALVRNDDTTIAHEFTPEFPEQFPDISYGLTQDVTPLLEAGATTRYLVPNSSQSSLGTGWTSPAFVDSGWHSGATGIGYSTTSDNFTVTYIQSNTTLNTLEVAEQVIATPSLQTSVTTANPAVINYYGTGGAGHFTGDSAFPTQTIGTDFNNFLIEAIAQIYIPTAGDWTFGVNSDDGFGLDIEGQGETFNIAYPNTRGASDTLGVFNVPTAGVYNLRMVMFERTGGASVEMFAAPGNHATFNSAFRLIGDVSGGGLETVQLGGVIATDVGPNMIGINRSLWTRTTFPVTDPDQYDGFALNMKYDDGFVAYLNGVEVARRNAPGATPWNAGATIDRDASLALTYETLNLTPFRSLLVEGDNVLAIHGLNHQLSDPEFLVLPEVVGVKNEPAERYFSEPSPGGPNAGAFVSYVADTKFTVDRGFYDAPFLLDITSNTPGATIRYTTNGTEPTLTNGTTFTSTLTISGTTTLRARAYRTGFEPSNVDTQSYIFIDDVLQQSPNGETPAGWPTGPINSQVLDYGMDPDIVNDPVWGPQLRAALSQISSVSLVTDLNHLFDPSTGIYVNANARGSAWERPVSVELLSANGSEEGFQIDSGFRIRGGFSRSPNNPKHSFRLFFNNDYDGALKYDLFGDEGADRFKNLDLRTSQNYSWAFQNSGLNTINRDVFSRDLMRDLEQPYTRSRYYHLYLNGQYWGLYQSEERPEADFAESYFGGDSDDYDVIKSAGSTAGYTIEATDGNIDAWTSLYTQARTAYQQWEASDPTPANRTYDESIYFRLQGLNPDGTRNPSYPVLLDVDNLIDYMTTVFYGGNLDSPLSNFLGNQRPNNWFGIYDRDGETGFQFMAHDSEHTLLDVNQNRLGPFFHSNQDNIAYSNPQWLHQDLTASEEYRLRFADRVQQHFFNDGPFSPQAGIDRFLARANEISVAIIAESARWGDAKRAIPFTKNNWQSAINQIANNYLPLRSDVVINQFIGYGIYSGQTRIADLHLYPDTVIVPQYRVNGSPSTGGQIGNGDQVSLVVPTETSDIDLINLGSTWKYLDNGSDQGTAWRGTSFDDSSWASGAAELGYGDGDEVTVVSYGPSASNKYRTTYFRHTFSANLASQFSDLTLQLRRDDGAVVYLNGQEVVRSNMPTGTINYNTFASSTISGSGETTLYSFSIDPGLLLNGNNVIGVEIHQASANNDDISFELALRGTATGSGLNIYYTTDGSDPRLPGGAINPAAVLYAGPPFPLGQSTPLLARSYDPVLANWSPLAAAEFFVNQPASAANLVVSEVNYHPHDPLDAELAIDSDLDADDFEFLEFHNIGTETIDLTGVAVVEGVSFTFPAGSQSVLAPGEYVVVVKDLEAFTIRYGGSITVAGEYGGSLSNSGESIEVNDRFGQTILEVEYEDGGDWPGRADGDASSLELLDPLASFDDSDNWESSIGFGGTPGRARLLDIRDIRINEVLSHTDPPLYDSIELYNTTSQPIDIGLWWLSDDQDNYDAFVIPAGTMIPAGGYVVFNELDFNPGMGTLDNDFALNSAHGDSLWLIGADGAGNPYRFVESIDFEAQFNGESYGLWPNGTGDLYPMVTRTLGAANSGPRIGPVVISELMYHPAPPSGGGSDDHLEYVEIHNPTQLAVDLTQWTITGVNFAFPSGLLLPAGGTLVVVSFDPISPASVSLLTSFEATYGVSASNFTLLGPYAGQLSNSGERVTLYRPDEPPLEEPQFYPLIVEDQIKYSDSLPWPGSADGGSDSLTRSACTGWGNDPTSWQAEIPTPGVASCAAPSEVVGRHIYYNNTIFDGHTAGVHANDEQAIATDKQALRPGFTATFANYTSSVDGITGIMIDFDLLPAAAQPTTADFEFRMGNSQNLGSWTPAPDPLAVVITRGAGTGGGDRITLAWAQGLIRGTWLEVRVKATTQTGLASDDLFYFGNAPGETGNSGSQTEVNASDFHGVRNNPRSFLQPAGISDLYDFNRDQRVNAADLMIVRDHFTDAGNRLILLSLPLAVLSAEGEAADRREEALTPAAIASLHEETESGRSKTEDDASSLTADSDTFGDDDRFDLLLAAYASVTATSNEDSVSKSTDSTDVALLQYLEDDEAGSLP